MEPSGELNLVQNFDGNSSKFWAFSQCWKETNINARWLNREILDCLSNELPGALSVWARRPLDKHLAAALNQSTEICIPSKHSRFFASVAKWREPNEFNQIKYFINHAPGGFFLLRLLLLVSTSEQWQYSDRSMNKIFEAREAGPTLNSWTDFINPLTRLIALEQWAQETEHEGRQPLMNSGSPSTTDLMQNYLDWIAI